MPCTRVVQRKGNNPNHEWSWSRGCSRARLALGPRGAEQLFGLGAKVAMTRLTQMSLGCLCGHESPNRKACKPTKAVHPHQ